MSESSDTHQRPQPTDAYIVDRPEIVSCDIVGDVHGCYQELVQLLSDLGHGHLFSDGSHVQTSDSPPRILFVGDIVDRGDGIIESLKLVIRLCTAGHALMVMGNHDYKFYRWLLHHSVTTHHGLQESIDDFQARPQEEQVQLRALFVDFFSTLPYAIRIDGGRAVVVHAAWHPWVEHEENKHRVRWYTIYGPSTGGTTQQGYPDRADWAAEYHGPELAVFGHQVYPEPYRTPYAIGIDTGCVFGRSLTALRYPSIEFVSVPSVRTRYTLSGEKVTD